MSTATTINSKIKIVFHKRALFEKIHTMVNLTLKQVYESLNPKFNYDTIFRAGEGSGRSGSFFFFSHDKKFIIKTLTSEELDLYLAILPKFIKHFKKHPRSQIAKIFGVFTL